jgi:D-alanyl-D-alanine carboxypeptidase (penicillin-binding protein 5/6)
LRLARFGLFVALAAGLGLGITTFANSAVGPRDAPRAVAEEQAAPEAALAAIDVADIPWPREGAAAVAIGDGETLTPSDEPHAMASVTKLLTALMVLEAAPLELGDAGPEYHFVERWNDSYEEYLARDESALPVPAGGVLTQHQLLQGMLLGSACNYADILVAELWGDDAAFAAAAADFLAAHGLDGITVTEPTGIDPANTARPSALIELGRLALADPVIAEIVATPAVEIPGAGLVENTNDLLADPGVVGLKTGTLDGSNLLSAKDIRVGDETVRVFAVVLSQSDDEARFVASRALYSAVEAQLAAAG